MLRILLSVFGLLFFSKTYSQNFINPDLNGNASIMQQIPTGWQNVPASDPVCRATNPGTSDTPDLTNVSGPWPQIGIMGTPYSGTTYLSGVLADVYGDGTFVYDEGIMQTVTGFTIGQSYTINFYQTIDSYQNGALDTSGSWRVYKDNSLIGTSAPTTSKIGIFAINHKWEKRSLTFTATATAHTIKFLPEDDDPSYNLSGTDSSGSLRMGIDSIWISQPCPTTVNLGPDITLCQNNSTTLNATTANATYVWQNNSTNSTLNVNSSGTYWVTVTANGCSASDTIKVTIKPNSNFTQNPTICNGNSFLLPSGNTTSIAGTYVDTIASINGCDSIITTNLSLVSQFNQTQSISICNGNTYILPGGNSVSVSGTYIDSLNSINGCDSIITTNLNVVTSFNITQNPVICSGSNYTLPSGNSVNNSGTYIDTLSSLQGCDSIITTVLTVNSSVTINQNIVTCSSVGYLLPGGTIVNVSGIYTDSLVSSSGCDSILITNLTLNTAPVAGVSPNVIITNGGSTTLTASGGGNYTWNPSYALNTSTGNTVTANPKETTTYCVIVENNNCYDTACITVFVETPCPKEENLDLPNAFSPNKDGINDEYCLQGFDSCIEKFSITIYNRWGELVFESNDSNFCWDGQHHNSILDAQVLVYFVKAKYISENKFFVKKGNISLVK